MKAHLKNNIHGILLLDKPRELSSNTALQRAKKLFNAKKAGHTGSLDPLATGMLPICFGEATKFSQFLLESNKSYEVEARLGIKTTTGDMEGKIILQKSMENIKRNEVEKVLQHFLGPLQQIPPMFSALKYQGKPLYELARQGIEIERTPRTIQIYDLVLKKCWHDGFILDVTCSKGTYIRTLIEDIGDQLGCGATVSALRRLMVHPYPQSEMVTFELLEQAFEENGQEGLNSFLLPVETSLESFPSLQLSTSAECHLKKGQMVFVPEINISGYVRLFSEENVFVGLGEIVPDGRIKPKRLVSQLKES